MAEEQKKITYDDWLNAFNELKGYNESIQDSFKQKQTAKLAAQAAHGVDEDAENVFRNDALDHYLPWLQIGYKKAGKKVKELSSKKNLEAILGSIDGDLLKGSLGGYVPQQLENVPDNYKKAVELHKEIFGLKYMFSYLKSDKLDREVEKALKIVTIKVLAEHYGEQYPDDKDEDNVLIKQALLTLADKDEDYRKIKFQKLAQEVIAKKEKKFYKEIGGEKNITNYLKCVLAEDEIQEYYVKLAQIKEQYDAQKAQAEQQQRLNHGESAYRRAA